MPRVPTARLRPLIEQELRRYADTLSMAAAIAQATGRDADTIYRKLYAIATENGNVSNATADTIISGLGRPDYWHSDLSDLTEIAPVPCEECGATLPGSRGPVPRRYCDDRCRQRLNNRLYSQRRRARAA